MRITSRAGIFDALFDDTNFMTFTPAVLLLAGSFGIISMGGLGREALYC